MGSSNSKRTLAAAVAALALASGLSLVDARTLWHQLQDYSFEAYVKEFHKVYATKEEYAHRKELFERKLSAIKAHNRDPTKRWKKGVNHLSDHTDEEYRVLLGYDKGLGHASWAARQNRVDGGSSHMYDLDALPAFVDWREKGVVTDVKDQGRCGSCWSFGAAETVESFWAIASGQLQDLSEQQILDCTNNPDECGGTGGCQGGTSELAFEMIIGLGGLASEWTYPYQSYHGQNFPQCSYNSTNTPAVASPDSYVVLPSNQYEPVISAVASLGPLAISVDASAWHDYESGVFDGCNATNPDIDHAVQLVGYGTDNDLGDYWLVRNSWSPKWGEDGYIRIARSANFTCGVDLNPLDGTGCKNGPPTVTVCGECGILFDVTYPLFSSA